ncbi:MAG: hydrogenase [Deltaproteobacteria bacterium RIFOXYB12_FULL_58_9]|nr:MAG: hydrogenase [Deltaproteobacteria bacterium RIFOXYB12_FULL_58_9]
MPGSGPFGGDEEIDEPWVTGGKRYVDIDRDVCAHTEQFPTRRWWIAFGVALCLLGLLVFSLVSLAFVGVGIVGPNSPVGWGTFIVNFVFWIGIGHAGTLISAVLFLFRQKWRTGINRSAEAMTLFAVACAGIFPIIHLGRLWFAYWLVPIPNGRGPLWINFNSALSWDIFAISTYGLVSAVFWYVGLLPDLATVRDRATHPWRKKLYNVLSFGWNGSNRAWRHYESAYLILAAFATPLVFSVHTIVSFDFATSIVPGWHTTIFPPYFVIGAIFSGFAMVITLMTIMRNVFNLKNYITINHMEAMAKIIMLTGMLVGFAYATEFFMAWYSGSEWEGFIFRNRAFGPYGWSYFIMFSCNALIPQLFWFKRLRRNPAVLFIIAILVNVGMWFERYVIVITSLHRDFLPSSWGMFKMTFFDWSILLGSFGLFFTLFLLFVRFLPAIAMSEVKGIMDPKVAKTIVREN